MVGEDHLVEDIEYLFVSSWSGKTKIGTKGIITSKRAIRNDLQDICRVISMRFVEEIEIEGMGQY